MDEKKFDVADLFSKGKCLSEDLEVRVDLIMEVVERLVRIHDKEISFERQNQFELACNELAYLLGMEYEYYYDEDLGMELQLNDIDRDIMLDICSHLPYCAVGYSEYVILPNGMVVGVHILDQLLYFANIDEAYQCIVSDYQEDERNRRRWEEAGEAGEMWCDEDDED
jgi:hypothetical protein